MSIIAGAIATSLGTCVAMRSPAAPLSAPALGFDNFVSVHGTPLTVPFETPLEPIPEVDIEPVGLVGRVARLLDKFSKNGAPRPKKSVSRQEFFAAIRPGNPFGIYGDGKGNWIFPVASRDAILNHFGTKRVIAHEGNILEFKISGTRDRVFMHQKTVDDPAPKFRLDYKALAVPEYARDTPIVFYHDETVSYSPAAAISPLAQWMRAVRELGYNIILVDSAAKLKRALKKHRPPVLLVSAVEDHIRFAYRAHLIAKKNDPSVVTVLGGLAAIPKFAELYDIVAMGDGQLSLPLILRRLLEIRNAGLIKDDVEPVAIESMIGGLEKFYSTGKKHLEWVRQFVRKGVYYPPVLPQEAAQSIADLSARRFISAPNGEFPIDVPIGYDPTGSLRIFVRGEKGVATPSVKSLFEMRSAAAARWKGRFNSNFPLGPAKFTAILRPVAATSDEYDALFARAPIERRNARGALTNDSLIYVQSGCRGEDRCAYCSVREKADGRRASVEQVIRMLKLVRLSGIRYLIFSDDLFVQNKRWILRLIERIKEEGLHKDINFRAQTRVETVSDDILDAFHEIGLSLRLGVETLDPTRAERMRKVGKGQGHVYVERAEDSIRRIKKRIGFKSAYYQILIVPGDNLADVARDVLQQFRLTERIFDEYRDFPSLVFNAYTIPNFGESFTEGMSGHKFAQPGAVPAHIPAGEIRRSGEFRTPWIRAGNVTGDFFPFVARPNGKMLDIDGVFKPSRFLWPTPIEKFIRALLKLDNGANLTLGGIYKALCAVVRSEDIINEEERADILHVLGEIKPVYEKLMGAEPWLAKRIRPKKN